MLTEKELYFPVKNEGIRVNSEKFFVVTKHPRTCKAHLGEISLLGKEVKFSSELKRTSIYLGITMDNFIGYMDVLSNLVNHK
ncbi:MAG: hypothetical protein WCV81_02580 [Microgenomates group bacterium]|jgi:hypothetical protein